MASFKLLYHDLTTKSAAEYAAIERVVSFVSAEIFKNSKPKDCLLKHLDSVVQLYKTEIVAFLELILPMIAHGLDIQKGAIFGFGTTSSNSTGTVAKISELDKDFIDKMNKHVPVTNLLEERNVGGSNYELQIRGKDNLQTVSRKQV